MTNTKTKMNYAKLSEDITSWIKEYAVNNKLDSLICGVSGGIDSACVSALCAKTGLPCYFYGIPIQSHPENSKNSELQLNWLKKNFNNVTTEITDLSDTFITFKNGLNLSDLAKANTKARLRMTLLYAKANTYNGLVVGTDNKVEGKIGFFTVGGDGIFGINPMGELLKTEVWDLGRYLGVPEEIINCPPSDGLHDTNKTDEQQMGISYLEAEFAIKYRENPWVMDEGFTKRQLEVLEIYDRLNIKNMFKSLPIPVFKVDKSKY